MFFNITNRKLKMRDYTKYSFNVICMIRNFSINKIHKIKRYLEFALQYHQSGTSNIRFSVLHPKLTNSGS